MVRHSAPHSLSAAAKAFCWRSERDSLPARTKSAFGPVRYRVILPRSRIRGDSCSPTRSKKAKLMRVAPWVSVACSVIGWSVALPRISSNT